MFYRRETSAFFVKKVFYVTLFFSLFLTSASAQKEVDSLRGLLQSSMETVDSVKAYISLSAAQLGSDFNASFLWSDSAINLARRIENDSLLLRAYAYNSSASIYLGDNTSAKVTLRKSLVLAKEIEDNKTILSVLNRTGVAYLNESSYDSADYFFQKTISQSFEFKDSSLLSGAYLNIGLVHNYQGQLVNAAENFIIALEIAEVLDDKKSAAYARNNFGYLLFEQEKYEQAIEVYDQCIEDGEILEDLLLLSDCYFMKAKIWSKLQDFEKAIDLCNQSINIDSQQNNVRGLTNKYSVLGEVYTQDNKLELAEMAFQTAIDYALSLEQNGQVLPECYLNLGSLEFAKHKYEKAGELLSKALLSAQENHLLDVMVESHLALSKNFAAMDKHVLAYQNHVTYSALRDSLIDEKKNKQINELETKYKLTQRELEIARLDAENQLNKAKSRQNGQLLIATLIVVVLLLSLVYMQFRVNKSAKKNAAQIAEQKRLVEDKSIALERVLGLKETLLKEIHHRVKNNLQVISSLISLQASTIENKKAKSSLIESQNRIKTIALIHQKLYQTDDLSQIDFHSYISQLAHIIASTYKHKSAKVQLDVDAHDLVLEIDVAVPLGLIINELLTNALKYAFLGRAHGKLLLQVTEENKQIILKVQDDGPGFDPEFDPKTSNSLGLKLVQLLVKQMRGKVQYNSEHGLQVIVVISPDFAK